MAPSKAIGLDTYITDADSRIKFTAMSDDDTIATATLPENGRTVTIKAVRVGTATITVTARDGDNDPVEAPISVTVVRNNAQPTTNDLSKANRDALEKVLYVNDGARPHTVTVEAQPGGTSSEPVEDELVPSMFKVVINETEATTDDKVSVKVEKGTGANKYVITVTPNPSAKDMLNNGGAQKVEIHPVDMFEAASVEAWTFMAKFNTTPKVLIDTIPTIRLTRPAAANIYTAEAADSALTATTSDVVDTIEIADYFDLATLDRKREMTGGLVVEGTPPAVADTELEKIDTVGDTVCEVAISTTSLAAMQLLNEAAVSVGAADANALIADTAEVDSSLLKENSQALFAIRIDSRFSDFGTPKVTNPRPNDPPTAAQIKSKDTMATKEGAFRITIRCTDKDDTAEVTGTVVVKDA